MRRAPCSPFPEDGRALARPPSRSRAGKTGSILRARVPGRAPPAGAAGSWGDGLTPTGPDRFAPIGSSVSLRRSSRGVGCRRLGTPCRIAGRCRRRHDACFAGDPSGHAARRPRSAPIDRIDPQGRPGTMRKKSSCHTCRRRLMIEVLFALAALCWAGTATAQDEDGGGWTMPDLVYAPAAGDRTRGVPWNPAFEHRLVPSPAPR
jgi:hypothetical protein